MSIVICDGNLVPLHHFCQWDTDRVITVTGLGLTEAPSFRFYNSNSTEACVVPSTLSNGVVTAQVPNALLQDGISLVASVVTSTANNELHQIATDANGKAIYGDSYEGTVLCSIRIPVLPNPKPEDYEEIENIEYVNWTKLSSEAIQQLDTLETNVATITAMIASMDIQRVGDDIAYTLDGTTWINLFSIDDVRSSKWFQGTKITGTSTTGKVFSSSGITDARVGDMYINTDSSTTSSSPNGNLYQCTLEGAASVAKWAYVGNIKGNTGTFQDPTATIGSGTVADGVASVSVNNSGTSTSAKFDFAFDNLRGYSPTMSTAYSSSDGSLSVTTKNYDGSSVVEETETYKAFPVPKGTWSASAAYKTLDIVTYETAAYMAKQDASGESQAPGNTTYWMRLISQNALSEILVFDCGTSTTNIE